MANMLLVAHRRGKPTYPLLLVRRLAEDPSARLLTGYAASTSRNLFEMSRQEVFAAVAALTERDFYKTMRSEKGPGYQDVYLPTVRCRPFPEGIRVYCKLTVERGVLVVVVSFKAG